MNDIIELKLESFSIWVDRPDLKILNLNSYPTKERISIIIEEINKNPNELDEIKSLINSILNNGVSTPLCVFKDNDKFKIVHGLKRFISICLILNYTDQEVKEEIKEVIELFISKNGINKLNERIESFRILSASINDEPNDFKNHLIDENSVIK